MEQEIHFTNKDFDFSSLSLSQPMAVQGGAYFTKIKCDSNPFYIQTPKCLTKQGINETNKKAYIDLMFTKDDEEVIEWLETLESTLVKLICEKKHLWFQDDIEYDDIEGFFNPITRGYKAGKFNLVRTSIFKNKNSNNYTCNAYDENENVIPINDINESNMIIPILEIMGIKFSARSFQVEIVGKQLMILNNKPVFQECLIKRKGSKDLEKNNTPQQEIIDDKSITIDNSLVDSVDEKTTKPVCESIIEELLDTVNGDVENNILDNNSNEENDITTEEIKEESKEEIDITKGLEDNENELINDNIEKNTNDLEDISHNFSVKNTNEIKLKKPNEVYWEIYKIAKQKAKQHKKAAISAYLEAKNIKKTYLLEDMDNSDSSDNEDNDSDSDIIKQEINNMVEEL
jgi:hypothetical protein